MLLQIVQMHTNSERNNCEKSLYVVGAGETYVVNNHLKLGTGQSYETYLLQKLLPFIRLELLFYVIVCF